MSHIAAPLPAALLGVSVLLAGALAFQIMTPALQFSSPKLGPAKAIASRESKPFAPPPLERFAEIDERPAFSPTRKPFKIPEAPVVEAPRTPPNLSLIGVIVGRGERIAIAKKPGAASALNLAVGEMVDGWEVVSIDADHIALQSNADVFDIKLQAPSAGRPPLPGGVPPQRQALVPGQAARP